MTQTPQLSLAIAGATGVVGRHVVQVAAERGHTVVELARSRGVDLTTGEGLAAALNGVDVIIDVSGPVTTSARRASAYFRASHEQLQAHGARAGVRHQVSLGILGALRIDAGYYAGKAQQERLLPSGVLPWTLLRATQFHEFVGQTAARAKVGPLQLAPKMSIQPVAAVEVARYLVELAEGEPQGVAQDLGGPRREHFPTLLRAWAAAKGSTGWIPEIALPGRFGQGLRDGSVLPGPDARLGTQEFTAWLAGQPGSTA